MISVLIQAGHENQSDPNAQGAVGPNGWLEIDWTPIVANSAVEWLDRHGVYTYREDAFFSGNTYDVDYAIFIHFNGRRGGLFDNASVGYSTTGVGGVVDSEFSEFWKDYYEGRGWEWGWDADNYTENLGQYYGYSSVVGTRAEILLEYGTINALDREAATWLSQNLENLGIWTAEAIFSFHYGFLPNSGPSLTIEDAYAEEGVDLSFALRLSEPVSRPVRVFYEIQFGDAEAGDIAGQSGWIEIEPQSQFGAIEFSTFADVDYENEGVTLNAWIDGNNSRATATGTIADSGLEPQVDLALPSISISDAFALEGGKLNFVVQLSALPSEEVQFTLQTYLNGTAGDYQGFRKDVTIEANPESRFFSFEVQTWPDQDIDPDDVMYVALENVSGAVVLKPEDAWGAGTIMDNTPGNGVLNNDPQELSAEDGSEHQDNEDSGTTGSANNPEDNEEHETTSVGQAAFVSVSLDPAADQNGYEGGQLAFLLDIEGTLTENVRVDWQLRPHGQGTISGADFAGTGFPSGSISISAGTQQKRYLVQIPDDGLVEGAEQAALYLHIDGSYTHALKAKPGGGYFTQLEINDPLPPETPSSAVSLFEVPVEEDVLIYFNDNYAPNVDAPKMNIGGSFASTRGHLAFDFSDVPFDVDEILSVELILHTDEVPYNWNRFGWIDIERAVEDWDATVTWATQPDGVYLRGFENRNTPGEVSTNITDLVTGWIAGDYANHGMILTARKADKESNSFFTSDAEEAHLRPYLKFRYQEKPETASPITVSDGDGEQSNPGDWWQERFWGTEGDDVIDGGAGNDIFALSRGTNVILGGDGSNDQFSIYDTGVAMSDLSWSHDDDNDILRGIHANYGTTYIHGDVEAFWSASASSNGETWNTRATVIAWADSFEYSGAIASAETGPDLTAPDIWFANLSDAQTVSGTIQVEIGTDDANGIELTALSFDGTLLGFDDAAPYVYTIDTTGYADGVYTLLAEAADPSGNDGAASISITIDNAATSTTRNATVFFDGDGTPRPTNPQPWETYDELFPGTRGDDDLYGGAGSDWFLGSEGDDFICGGDGTGDDPSWNQINYNGPAAYRDAFAVSVDLVNDLLILDHAFYGRDVLDADIDGAWLNGDAASGIAGSWWNRADLIADADFIV